MIRWRRDVEGVARRGLRPAVRGFLLLRLAAFLFLGRRRGVVAGALRRRRRTLHCFTSCDAWQRCERFCVLLSGALRAPQFWHAFEAAICEMRVAQQYLGPVWSGPRQRQRLEAAVFAQFGRAKPASVSSSPPTSPQQEKNAIDAQERLRHARKRRWPTLHPGKPTSPARCRSPRRPPGTPL